MTSTGSPTSRCGRGQIRIVVKTRSTTRARSSSQSPLFGGSQNFSRVAFEADLPRIEAADFGGTCNRFTGANCVNPPPGASFYPIYSTADPRKVDSGSKQLESAGCVWQLGGTSLKGTTNTFGGNSVTEFGPLLFSFYPNPNPAVRTRTNNFRNVLDSNPCPA